VLENFQPIQPGTQQWFDRFGDTAEGVNESVDTIGLSSFGVQSVVRVTNDNTDVNYPSLRRYDRDGNVIFTKGLSAALVYRNASVDVDGNTYLLFEKRTPIPNSSNAQLDAYVQKYGPTGELLLNKIVRTTSYYTLNSAAYQGYSEIQVVGDFLYIKGKANGSIFKFDLSGNLLWGKGVGREVTFSMAVSSDGSVYATASDRFDDSPKVLKFNSDGSLAWERLLTGDYIPRKLVTDDSYVYLTGSSNQGKAYLWKYDSAGNQIFTRQYTDGDSLGSSANYSNALYTTGYSVMRNGQ